MKKVFYKAKLPTPSKLVRRMLPLTPNVVKTSKKKNKPHVETTTSENMKNTQEISSVDEELTNLKKQISMLQLSVDAMQNDAEQREKKLATIAREKQTLCSDLRREKRSSTSLRKQLEDERQFYYKEKEQYCHEMNKCKKLKKKLAEERLNCTPNVSKGLVECKNEISKLKEALNQTLEANYNLSIKFLRMKNTKMNLKQLLQKQEEEHKDAMRDLQIKISNIKNDIADVVDKRFTLPISPSNKKHLQIIKQNGILMYENLCLQMEADKLANDIRSLKVLQFENKRKTVSVPSTSIKKSLASANHETKSKSDKRDLHERKKTEKSPTHIRSDNMSSLKNKIGLDKTTQNVENVEMGIKQSKTEDIANNVVKIYERKESVGLPEIIILPQNNKNEPSETLNQNSKNIEQENKNAINPSDYVNNVESASVICTDASEFTQNSFSQEAIRTQSAPEIVQTSLFVSKRKT